MRILLLPTLKEIKRYFLFGFFFLALFIAAEVEIDTTQPKPEPIYHGNAASPKVAFACNVFWGEEFLPSMLKTLEENNVHITFFIGGTWAKSNPDALRQIAQRGHELANHSYSHPHPNALSKAKNQEQIQKAEDIVKEITGVKTALYAPPYGEFNETVLQAAAALQYPTILWSIDTVDWKRPPAEQIKRRVLSKAHNGAIILMHPTEPTAKALPSLIAELKAKGFEIATVSEVLQ